MKEQPIICFMGLDGSGKSTSINHAYEQLQKRGFDVEIVRAAYVIKYMSFFLKLGKRLVMKKKSDPYGGDYKAYLEKMRQQSKTTPYLHIPLFGSFHYKWGNEST